MPTQYTTKQLQRMTDKEIVDAIYNWACEFATANTLFRVRRAKRMIDKIRREYECRGLDQ